jgi:hypothetical protein
MRIVRKGIVIALLGTSVVLLASSLPGLPWSANLHHTIKRIIVKSEIKLARWRGKPPRSMSIAGRPNVPAAQIQALDSRSGWAALASSDADQ